MPRHEEEGDEVEDDEYGILDEHVQGRGDGGFHLADVAAHARYDVAAPFVGDEGEGEVQDLVIDHDPDIADDAGA